MLVDTAALSGMMTSRPSRNPPGRRSTTRATPFMVDAKTGPQRRRPGSGLMLRRSNKPVILTVNKVDNFAQSGELLAEFMNWACEPVPISPPPMA